MCTYFTEGLEISLVQLSNLNRWAIFAEAHNFSCLQCIYEESSLFLGVLIFVLLLFVIIRRGGHGGGYGGGGGGDRRRDNYRDSGGPDRHHGGGQRSRPY